ncbi:MAG TPA: hypothetical protein VMM36_01870 [Opitutaceae bacterium]|nr:hypothetical protein [Opitutaceae bacterium]
MKKFAKLRLSAAATAVAVILGSFAAPAMCGEVTRVSIDIPEALATEFGSPPQRSVRLEIFFAGKKVEAVLVLPAARNPALAGWDARDVESTLAFKGARLEGAVTANIIAVGRAGVAPWKCTVSAVWKDGALAGTAELSMGNGPMPGRAFSASPTKLAAMKGGDGFVELLLPGVGEVAGVRAGIEFRDGIAVASAAFSPLIHPVWRRLDVSGVSLKRGRLAGKLLLLASAGDTDVPAAGARELDLKLDLREGLSPIDVKKRTGVAILSAVPVLPERAEVELAFDGPLVGGERWRRRAVVRLDVSRDTISASALLNGRADPGWSGVADAVSLGRDNGRFDGSIEATVASATVQPGLYDIRFKGEVVGPWIVGTFESELAGAEATKGDFTGWFAGAGG